MKKKIALVICLAIALASLFPLIVACKTEKLVEKLEIIDPKTEAEVGEEIDYDSIKVKVYYQDGTSKESTVSALGATVVKANLSAAGNTSYTVSYQGKSVSVNVTVSAPRVVIKTVEAFTEPEFYTNYKQTISSTESSVGFKNVNEAYEVGNVNKFLFKPRIVGFDADDNKLSTTDVATVCKVFVKNSAEGEYSELTGADLTSFVEIEDNTYKFSDAALGKYVKLEVSLDESRYDISDVLEVRTLTCEFVVVDGYNAYDQFGLSVMDNHHAFAWKDLKDRQLEADDKKLSEYTDVKTVVLHASFTLDPNNLPAQYFWTESTDSYRVAYDMLDASDPDLDLKDKLVGSLRDGTGSGEGYYVLDENGERVEYCNIQKGLFTTTQCSLSGNYNSIEVGKDREDGQRNLYTVVSKTGESTNAASLNLPESHWSVFKFIKLAAQADQSVNLGMKNLSLTGNRTKSESLNGPGGMLMANCYVDEFSVQNVNAYGFYTNIVGDGADDVSRANAKINVSDSKFNNSFSNMIYAWKGHITVTNSEMKDAGGPLFLLVDGGRRDGTEGDNVGPSLKVDSDSVLSSYTTGSETWYVRYNAQQALAQIKALDLLFAANQMDVTMEYVKEGDGMRPAKVTELNKEGSYINVIALMIPQQSKIFNGDGEGAGWATCGQTTTTGEGNENTFSMHNSAVTALRGFAAVQKALNKVPVLQSGNNYMWTDSKQLLSASASAMMSMMQGKTTPITDTEKQAWNTTHTDLMCVYLRVNEDVAPEIGVILGIDSLTK